MQMRITSMAAAFVLFAGAFVTSMSAAPIRLLVRADDMGSSHSANLGCIQSFREGIVRSVEVMVPGPWYAEAVKMLEQNAGLDVGVHLTLTSEWENIKWRPISHAPSLTDAEGYFYPMIWNNQLAAGSSLKGSRWKIEEVEQELRAQIEKARRNIPRISHLSYHMGFSDMDPRVSAVCEKLAKEYHLDIEPSRLKVRYAPHWGDKPLQQRTEIFVKMLEKLQPGTYLFVEHPAILSSEMEAVGHTGNYTVAADRDMVVKAFTSPTARAIVQKRGIELISYKDLLKK